MESNGIPGGIYSNLQNFGLEMSLQNQNPRSMPRQPQNPLPTMMGFANLESDYHPQPQHSSKQNYPFAQKSRNQSLALSDDDTAENSADDGKKKSSPWHRMKWTDNMIRLLIMVVFYIGDEVGSEVNNNDPKKKSGGVLQKKGKWKSVSRAMMERGFYVSPQQCEDKFNDLNKRYKRVNDILGKGTACRVVENQSLLESMDHISPKMKEEVKKLLNSKHLFFREMCAYHNSCGHAGASGSGPVQETTTEPVHNNRATCLHSSEHTNGGPVRNDGPKLSKDEDDDSDDSDEDNDGDDDDDDDDSNSINERSRKRAKKGPTSSHSQLIQQLSGELTNLMQDGTKGVLEKRQWMKLKLMGLEEQRVGISTQAFELEKQRLKWLKFSTKKEREMEREKLANERLKLENERMVLVLRQKELDLIDQIHLQQQFSGNKRSDPSSITG